MTGNSEVTAWQIETAAYVLGVSSALVNRWIDEGLLDGVYVKDQFCPTITSVMELARMRTSAGRFAVSLVEEAKTNPELGSYMESVRERARGAARVHL